ncbi:MAG: OmpA family protein [Endomicrobia bacterium]|nr:OmpA family protein [Endomicrobiia bacterium]MDW8055952.1 OmpA family protein [Elusimicrobiota bacterium]
MKKIFVILFYISGVLYAVAKYEEVLIPAGVRCSGAGGNFVTMYDTAEGLFYNPAVSGLCPSGEITLAHRMYFVDCVLEQFSLSLPLGIINFGITGRMFSSPEIREIYNFIPGDKFKLDTKIFNGSIGFRINKNLSFGLGGKYYQQKLAKSNISSMMYDVGMLFITNDELFTLGYSLVNYSSVEDNDYRNPIKHNVGVRLKFNLPIQETKINFIISSEIDYYSLKPIYSYAIEHWGSDVLGLRVGYIHDADKNNLGIFDHISFFTSGLSLRIGNFGIDYAYLPNSLLGTTHNIGISLKFISRKKIEKIKETFLPCELTVEPVYFSPNDDGYLDNVFFRHNISTYTNIIELLYTISDRNNNTVFIFKSTYVPTVVESFYTYDGKDNQGNILPDGEYFVEFSARDRSRNTTIVYKSDKARFVVDTNAPSVELTVSTESFSPDGDNIDDEIQFTVAVKDEHSYIEKIELTILTGNEKKIYKFPIDLLRKQNVFEQILVWNGKDEIYNETVPNGEYKLRCRVFDVAGNKITKEVTFKVYVPPKKPEKVIEKIVERQDKLFYIKGAKVTLDERGIIVTYQTDELFLKPSGEINPKFYDSLSSLAEIIKESFLNKKISIEGHTDSVGDEEENRKKSFMYASTIYSYFVNTVGLEKNLFEVKGWGEQKPVASNKSKLGRAQNRRVEIIIWNK